MLDEFDFWDRGKACDGYYDVSISHLSFPHLSFHKKIQYETLTTKCSSYGEPLENGDKTGVCLQEAADPYYIYLDSGADVDIVSIKGGKIPYDTKPKTKNVRRFLDDKSAMSKLNNSTKIDDVNFDDYDLVFMAGGWGAAFDLPTSDVLGQKVAKALATGKPMIASTCHGALGFVRANRTDGTPYIKGT